MSIHLLIPHRKGGLLRVGSFETLGANSVKFEMNHEKHRVAIVEWVPGGPPNQRADDLIADLTGVHLRTAGNVLVHDLAPEDLVHLLGL